MTNDTTPAELDAVLDAAVVAAPALTASSPTERAGWLESVANALDAAAAELIPLAISESHLTEARLTGELTRTTFQLRLFAETLREGSFLQATIDHADPTWPMGARPDLRRTVQPIGPVAVYAASNFPFAFSVAGGDTASAIAAGVPTVVKGNPGHPELSLAVTAIVTDALASAGAPRGAFALVTGFETGQLLIVDPRIAAASFTGSLAGGRALFDLAVARPRPIPFFGELGSINPAIVTRAASAARADEIATGFLGSVELGVGQFCTKPGLLFVPADSAIPDLVATAARDRPGAPMLSEHIASGYVRVLGDLAGHPAVRVLAGQASGDSNPSPTILATTARELIDNQDALLTECFGPTTLIVRYESDDELLRAVRAIDGQLTATIHAEDGDAILDQLVPLLAERAGRVLWNGWPTGVSVTYAMQHGGPYPATTSSQHTSVGTAAIDRFLRPVTYQGAPAGVLPPQLRDDNPWSVPQRIDGVLTLPLS